jgi:putative tryptophan/tyrosine transport system permease protein
MLNWLASLPGAVAQGLIWGIAAIGVYITFRILDIADMTVDGSICTGAAVCTVLIIKGVNPWLALLCAFSVGLVAGCVTGILHIGLGIPAILAGILTQMSLWSINLKILGKANQAIPARSYDVLLSQMNIPKALILLGIATVVVVALLYLFFGTELGCSIRATGCNPTMSRAQGINTGVNQIIGLALSNGLVALSGALLCQYQGYADINMGRGAVVIGLAAVVIGDAVVKHISPNFAVRLAGVAVGAIIYYFVYQTVIFLGFDADLLKMFSAVVVALFLGVPYLHKIIRGAHRKVKAGKGDGSHA